MRLGIPALPRLISHHPTTLPSATATMCG
jgi:hypothetical protein